VEAISGPNGDLARCVALVELEIHIQRNKLADKHSLASEWCTRRREKEGSILRNHTAPREHLQLNLLLELDVHQVRLRAV
jgi:hypothetical protein